MKEMHQSICIRRLTLEGGASGRRSVVLGWGECKSRCKSGDARPRGKGMRCNWKWKLLARVEAGATFRIDLMKAPPSVEPGEVRDGTEPTLNRLGLSRNATKVYRPSTVGQGWAMKREDWCEPMIHLPVVSWVALSRVALDSPQG